MSTIHYAKPFIFVNYNVLVSDVNFVFLNLLCETPFNTPMTCWTNILKYFPDKLEHLCSYVIFRNGKHSVLNPHCVRLRYIKNTNNANSLQEWLSLLPLTNFPWHSLPFKHTLIFNPLNICLLTVGHEYKVISITSTHLCKMYSSTDEINI